MKIVPIHNGSSWRRTRGLWPPGKRRDLKALSKKIADGLKN
jgi:hypothetical protein